MKSWKSKTKGWVTEEPEDWMIDRKTVDGKEVYIGDEVFIYDGYRSIAGKHKIIKGQFKGTWVIKGLAYTYGVRLMLASHNT